MKWLGLWFMVVGVWPFSDPGHSDGSLMSMVDILVHVFGVLIFFQALSSSHNSV